jgi:hypothetical protein
VDGLVVAHTMYEWNEDALQEWIFARQSAAGCGGFCTFKHSGAYVKCRANNLAEKCGWSNRDLGVVRERYYIVSNRQTILLAGL